MLYNEFLKHATACALAAGEIIKEGYNSIKNLEFKSYGNPVTQYDRQSESLIVDMIARNIRDTRY